MKDVCSTRKRNICFIIYNLSGGGAEKVVSLISNELIKHYNVTVFLFENKIDFQTNADIICINEKSKTSKISKVTTFFKRIVKLKKLKRELKIELSISFLPIINLYNILSNSGEKTIISIRSFKNVQNNNIFQKIINAYVFNKANHILSCSKQISTYLSKYSSKLTTIYNPINKSIIKQKMVEKIDNKTKEFVNTGDIFITVGKIINYKGYDELIDAFCIYKKINSKAKLIIIGKDYLNNTIMEKCINKNIDDSVLFTGYVNNPYKYLKVADVFVLSSYYEGFPNVVIEAMACNLPIVSVDCPSGPKEILTNGFSENKINKAQIVDYGVLCPPIYIEESTTKNNAIYELSNGLNLGFKNRIILSKKSKKRSEDFEIETICLQYLEMIDSVINKE